jgi:hypothetical protein
LAFRAYEILTDGSGFLNARFPTLLLGEVMPRYASQGGMSMLCGPKGSEEPPILQCSVCGRRTELFELPGKSERYCLECSADVAAAILLTTEIDAATMAGQHTESLVMEFAQLSHRLLERAQSA